MKGKLREDFTDEEWRMYREAYDYVNMLQKYYKTYMYFSRQSALECIWKEEWETLDNEKILKLQERYFKIRCYEFPKLIKNFKSAIEKLDDELSNLDHEFHKLKDSYSAELKNKQFQEEQKQFQEETKHMTTLEKFRYMAEKDKQAAKDKQALLNTNLML